MNWRLWTVKDIAGAILVAVVVGGLLAFQYAYPNWHQNFGFGPDWKCFNPMQSEPICLKKPATQTTPAN
jgi:hypothetical protein